MRFEDWVFLSLKCCFRKISDANYKAYSSSLINYYTYTHFQNEVRYI